jgi:hypothetical protein
MTLFGQIENQAELFNPRAGPHNPALPAATIRLTPARWARIGGMDEPRKERLPVAVIAVMLSPVPVAYVLSAGPAWWLLKHGYLKPHVVDFIYGPLLWLCHHYQPLNKVVLWLVRTFTR